MVDPKPATLTRTEIRQRKTRARLIEAVRTLTAEKGVDALTIRDIAEEADISMGGFYNHFESKDELLKEAVQEIVFQSGEIIDAINAASSDPVATIATAFTTFDRMIQEDPILGWFVVRVTAHHPDWASSLYERFLRDVQEGSERGDFDLPNLPLAIEMVTACLLSFYRARLRGEAEGMAGADFIQLMLRMLGADERVARETAARIWQEAGSHSQET